jgi:hypothetical protein
MGMLFYIILRILCLVNEQNAIINLKNDMVKKNLDTGRLKKIINFGLEKVTLYMFRGLRG